MSCPGQGNEVDFVIRSGRVVDGTGKKGFVADVAVKDGIICAIGQDLPVVGKQEMDARGLLVTPGWIDVHTHFDAQCSWDPYLSPSSSCGVTTCVMGNCGIGFAPCQKDRRSFLAHLVEAVEDIPERIIAAGMNYDFETFEEYLESLTRAKLGCDVAVLVSHSALRAWVMGERANLSDKPGGPAKHPLTEQEVEAIAGLVRDAVASGAFGFSTSRLLMHRDPQGILTPGTMAGHDELKAIARAVAEGGGGLFEMANDFSSYDDVPYAQMDAEKVHKFRESEYEWMMDVTREHGRKVAFSFNCLPFANTLPYLAAINSAGGLARGQCTARAQGLLQSFGSRVNIFQVSETYRALEKHCREAGLDLLATLRRAGKRDAIIKEADYFFTREFTGSDRALQEFLLPFSQHFPWTPHYEPDVEADSMEALARKEGRPVLEVYYDFLLDGGLTWKPFGGSYDMRSYDHTCAMMCHPHVIPGFADAGAHGTLFQDAAIASVMLGYLARNRTKGPKMNLEHAVKVNTLEIAQLIGLSDRGVLQIGKKADINVIDLERMSMGKPYLARDMPLGQERWMQDVQGYRLTLLSGSPTVQHGRLTGALPGRLLRNPRRDASAWRGVAWEVSGDFQHGLQKVPDVATAISSDAKGGASAASRILKSTYESRSRL